MDEAEGLKDRGDRKCAKLKDDSGTRRASVCSSVFNQLVAFGFTDDNIFSFAQPWALSRLCDPPDV